MVDIGRVTLKSNKGCRLSKKQYSDDEHKNTSIHKKQQSAENTAIVLVQWIEFLTPTHRVSGDEGVAVVERGGWRACVG